MEVGVWTYQPMAVPAVASLSAVVSPNLVTNGGFETGQTTGWTRSGDTTADSVIYESNPNPTHIHSGFYSYRAGPDTLVFLTHTVPTTPGPRSNLDFRL